MAIKAQIPMIANVISTITSHNPKTIDSGANTNHQEHATAPANFAPNKIAVRATASHIKYFIFHLLKRDKRRNRAAGVWFNQHVNHRYVCVQRGGKAINLT